MSITVSHASCWYSATHASKIQTFTLHVAHRRRGDEVRDGDATCYDIYHHGWLMLEILLVNSRIIWIFHWGQLLACLLINLIASARISCSSVSWWGREFVQSRAEQSSPHTSSIGPLQGKASSLHWIIMITWRILSRLSMQNRPWKKSIKMYTPPILTLAYEDQSTEWWAYYFLIAQRTVCKSPSPKQGLSNPS